jgi:hypothetical protein
MKLIEFIKRLKEIEPSKENLIKEGFEERFLDVIISGYNLPSKISVLEYTGQSAIIELCSKFDVSFLRFGDYAFENEPIDYGDGSKIFCTSSNTYLVIGQIDDEIREYDKEENSLLNYCSLNEDSFLNCLLYILELESLKLQGETSSDWPDVVSNLLEKAINASGGNRYKNFVMQFFED